VRKEARVVLAKPLARRFLSLDLCYPSRPHMIVQHLPQPSKRNVCLVIFHEFLDDENDPKRSFRPDLGSQRVLSSRFLFPPSCRIFSLHQMTLPALMYFAMASPKASTVGGWVMKQVTDSELALGNFWFPAVHNSTRQ
jgi:hypothetical protein